jgi:hypothetical protein
MDEGVTSIGKDPLVKTVEFAGDEFLPKLPMAQIHQSQTLRVTLEGWQQPGHSSMTKSYTGLLLGAQRSN